MKERDWYKNEWIGKATLDGLKEAMQELNDTWGTHANDFNMGRPLTLVRFETEYPGKKAA
ncbi:MAG: hypothetical protein ABFD81_16605 [Syntrophaceae bacterium]